MANHNLTSAKRAKNDEFYTQWVDIEREINAYLEYNPDVFKGKTVLLPCDDPEWSNFTKYFAQNFERFGLRKLISTSYAPNSKPVTVDTQLTLFETEDPQYDPDKAVANGKIFTVTRDTNNDQRIDYRDLQWNYLQGDGDFRSPEVRALRDEADIIITNPPFSLFREFLAWVLEAGRKFAVISSKNAVTYKEVFPLIKDNQMWSGAEPWTGGMWFEVPENALKVDRVEDGKNMAGVPSVWFTNLDHGRRHQPLSLMTEAENIKFSRHSQVRGVGYRRYDNYDAIEVPFVDAIPDDYEGVMGVPITFLDKYAPEQFEILGATESEGKGFSGGLWTAKSKTSQATVDGCKVYKRLFIRHRRGTV